MDQALSIGAFVIFAILWAAFAVALAAGPDRLDAVWSWIGSLPLVLQVLVWLLFLPVVAGLWIWESGWPLVLRLLLVGGLAVVTLYAFAPRWLFEGRSP